ncbi:precorrin-6A synthase (deacetylating) [Xaviernesmea oryzae]|uniref:Precorrin-6A synthase [deacetylating] n=1 Tax=Xaviernesmea oryzae TaxID=464029 RepID=A0A1Q9AZ28_9HYPH|nr:precorrin-6A synthase (deacetylating) [Xaviernesmea oryzae]OLP60952.1 precorrin-6A synthase (deacetylating) [Xaviernesmea oryzae]SEL20344.1 precorrin-6A synthase (deacetylating) [Xaviernesmea oryzae]
MRHIKVIGIGTGNPDHLTIEAVRALNAADVLFLPDKGEEKAELAAVRHQVIATYGTRADQRHIGFSVPKRQVEGLAYGDSVDAWHAALADNHARLIASHLGEAQTGAFLVWGDPMLYDSTLRILDRVKATGLDFSLDVIAGITSLQLLTARHQIPLNGIGQPVTITTGRRLSQDFPETRETAVVMLDGEQAFLALDDPDAEIYWGAYLGMPQEIVISGRLGSVRQEIATRRAEARAAHGWIMDIYLLRKPLPST